MATGTNNRVRKADGSSKREKRSVKRSLSVPASMLKKVLSFGPLQKLFKQISRVSWIIPPYFKNSWQELKQVSWPNRRDTRKMVKSVFIFALILGVMVALVDKGLDALFKNTVLK